MMLLVIMYHNRTDDKSQLMMMMMMMMIVEPGSSVDLFILLSLIWLSFGSSVNDNNNINNNVADPKTLHPPSYLMHLKSSKKL